jgi:hypothetical protein
MLSSNPENAISLYTLTLSSLVVTLFTTKFTIKNFYIRPTECIHMFRMVLRTNSNYFPVQH